MTQELITQNPDKELNGASKVKPLFKRVYTEEGVHPYDMFEWKKFDAVIKGPDGIHFKQDGVEFPASWSQKAVNIVSSKYFYGQLNEEFRESSLKELVDRVIDTITDAGWEAGYFDSREQADIFSDELKYMVVDQRFAFNSPVWFNIGTPERRQASACFINHVEDNMESIMALSSTEAKIFKWGSGAGVNLSALRAKGEPLSGGGEASGPVSFMKGYDAFAGVIKSGGKKRRAAKMIVMDADHPDIEEFVNCKVDEEKKAHALIEAGYDSGFAVEGGAYDSVFFQNANHSVRVSDKFMSAVENGDSWELRWRGDHDRPNPRVDARELMQSIAQAAWECGDPGIQYDDTINHWHTAKSEGRQVASNPCCFVGETLVDTSEGPICFDELVAMGSDLPHAFSWDCDSNLPVLNKIKKVWIAGQTKKLVEVRTDKGVVIRCTPEHRFLTKDLQWVEAQNLNQGIRLRKVSRHVNENRSSRASSNFIDEHRGDANDVVISVEIIELDRAVNVYDLEVEGTHNFGVMSEGSSHSVIAHNSEYMFLNNTACNLASINLLKFIDEEQIGAHMGYEATHDAFDVDKFKAAVHAIITAQDILVSYAEYPTELISEETKKWRTLGLGYANLGASLMYMGMAYDSELARDWSGAVTSLMCGEAYRVSAKLAERLGPFDGFERNRESMLDVLREHQRESIAASGSPEKGASVHSNIWSAANEAWDVARYAAGQPHGGIRNAQTTVLAPTGTISFMMDCVTTGVEPEIALIKYKTLVGGGVFKMVNPLVEKSLQNLGYSPEHIKEVLEYVAEHGKVEGSEVISEHHLSVFDTSFGDQTIHWKGHIHMMAAVQPFLAGAISKCVSGETLVTTGSGLVRIEDLHEGGDPDSFTPMDLVVDSLDGRRTTSEFYYGGRSPVWTATLKSGRQITGTDPHRLRVVGEDGKLAWKRMDEIQEGDYVAVRLGSEMWGSNVKLPEFPLSPMYGNQNTFSQPSELTENLAEFLGMLTADGHVVEGNYTVGITKNDQGVLDRFENVVSEVFGLEPRRVQDSRNGVWGSRVHSKSLVEWLSFFGFSKEKIPARILSAPREVVVAYMNGLYLDGYVSGSIAISQRHGSLIRELQTVWGNMGVDTYVNDNVVDGQNYPVLRVYSHCREKAASVLDFIEDHKAVRASELLDGQDRSPMPVRVGQIQGLVREQRKTHEHGALMDARTSCSTRRVVMSAAEDVRLEFSGEELSYHYYEVDSIVRTGEVEVYDLSVPETHAFVANGIMNHNTVNMPEDATVDDVGEAYMMGWKKGLKALAVYRDGCKRSQPLSTKEADNGAMDVVLQRGDRVRLPETRTAITHKFSVAGHNGYLTVGLYENGQPGEIFIVMSKKGSIVNGLLDSFATSVSIGLQHGVPLSTFCDKFKHVRFEPSGLTGNGEILIANSVVDYVAKWLELNYLTGEDTQALIDFDQPVLSVGSSDASLDSPMCLECGGITQRSGTCFSCTNCGATTGCG